MNCKTVFILLFVYMVALTPHVRGCDHNQTRQGCRIEGGKCLCGFGCYSEYRYESREECRQALSGQKNDLCQPNPCYHGGSCNQISYGPGFRCRCEGTGYFGMRCQYACPTQGKVGQESFPYECIVI